MSPLWKKSCVRPYWTVWYCYVVAPDGKYTQQKATYKIRFSIRFLKNVFFLLFRYIPYFYGNKSDNYIKYINIAYKNSFHCTYLLYSNGAEILCSICTMFNGHVIINYRVGAVSYDALTGNYSNKNTWFPEGFLLAGLTGFRTHFSMI